MEHENAKGIVVLKLVGVNNIKLLVIHPRT